ncbi:MAG: single-stranded-DNA-specific exonuclease RecJ [bacterium]
MKYKVAEVAPKEFKEAMLPIHEVISNILWQRGVRTKEEAEAFFHPSWEKHVHDPFLFQNMSSAVRRILSALEKSENITIHGDYDADGVTGSCVVYETLTLLKTCFSGSSSQIGIYIPHRENEGYGLRMSTVDKLAAEQVKLIITVDCGIGSVAETDYAHSLGIDSVVVDHHAMPPELSKTAIIIHPHVPGETYPFKPLAAVGVAFKLACALLIEARFKNFAVPVGFEKWLLDFVAIATITDIVPLIGENRVFETYGLKVLQKTRRPGFRAIYRVAGIEPETITSQTIGFGIGPRINAAGRMRHAKLAFDTLTATNQEDADVFANELQLANVERQKETEKMVLVALEKAKAQSNEKVILLAEDGWPHGLVGLVASKLTSEFHLPAYVVGKTEKGLVGSGRSIPGFHVTDALKKFPEFLDRFGGHPQACGFTVKNEASLAALFEGLRAHARIVLENHSSEKEYNVDALLPLNECTLSLAEAFGALEPFGDGNPKPTVLVTKVIIKGFNTIGKNQEHLRISSQVNGVRLSLIAFKMANRMHELSLGAEINVIGEFGINEWQGRRDAQVVIKDFEVCS